MSVPVRASIAAFVLLACSSDAQREDPFAHPPHASVPPIKTENAAPLDNVSEAQREQAIGVPHTEPGEVRADFEPLGKDISMRASAGLADVTDGVRVHLKVREGQPGSARLVVEDAPCRTRRASQTRAPTALEERGATPAVMADTPPGGIAIEGGGQVDYTTTLKGKRLEPGAENSLAGQALVLYEARDLPSPIGRTPEVPVACAMVPSR